MLYMNGEWRPSTSGKMLQVKNPATNELIQEVAYGGAEETREAIQAATDAFSSWKKRTGKERGKYLEKIAALLRERTNEIAIVMTSEMGKPLPEAIREIGIAIDYVDWYAEEAKRVYGDTLTPSHPDKHLMVLKEPVGVTAAITPWNFPIAMITRKLAPALAAGCTVILKPASATPITAIKVFECFHEAELPKGVANLIIGSASEIANEMTSNPEVKKITFTGSTEVGKKLIRDSAQTMKKVSMELGGHAPFIIFEDADLDKAVEGIMLTKFKNCGQTCISTNRIYVSEKVSEECGKRLAERVKNLKIGNGLEAGIDVGPMIDEKALEKVEEHVQDALELNGKLLCGGKRMTLPDLPGSFYEPTVIHGANENMKIITEETFGPVAPIIPFSTEEEVLTKVNHKQYGLASYLYTKDLSRAFRIMRELDYGIIGINDPTPIVAQAPFGGVKESGIGREGGKYGLEEYLEEKFVSIQI
ncbi:NAD-dependent succinate-semialdehyde dehydrogenase [Fredinandcohnia quinoae]|uniref:NAD-dependent succinate-semialdehyde dehydrogenase n=1 Tax=Fredinandcohnia quinoae TaxID=2918902 RepID=A0AAW5DZK7_9BACI|nr:NAD-dependent succinate-semialdehyde dehydrogenase [Fredinandcohnia sp. SECRCQ15]MCH1625778.1 NAD-dependent succinate-semialdehyde dehydrogenase [Fredinandcohnia sp. SECRCQ15]